MRVIAGIAKGHKLVSPQGLDVRPTLDRVKEAVFSSLYPYLEGAQVLDLFAGAGSLGIEALSRGAKSCCFVDISRKSLDCVKKNLTDTKLSDKATLKLMSFETFLKTENKKFSIVFLDPPYSVGFEDKVFENFESVVEKNTVVVLETEYEPCEKQGFSILKSKKYGRVYITIYIKE